MRLAGATTAKKEPAPAKIGRWQLRVASPKHPIVRSVIAQPPNELFGFCWRQRADVFPQLMHVPDLAEETISH
jgi:hypothetical protein